MVFNIKIIDKTRGITFTSVSGQSKVMVNDYLSEKYWNEGVLYPTEYIEDGKTIHFNIYLD